jgi:hypothetical protein
VDEADGEWPIKVLLLHRGAIIPISRTILHSGLCSGTSKRLKRYDAVPDWSTSFYMGTPWGGILPMEYALNYQQHLRGW